MVVHMRRSLAALFRAVLPAVLLLASCALPDRRPVSPSAPAASVAPVVQAAALSPPAEPAPAPRLSIESSFIPVVGFDGAFVVRGVPPSVRVTTVRMATDDGYACALTRDGAVWCWRSSNKPTSTAEPRVHATPTAIEGLEHVTDISGSCALAGGIRCFGSSGQERKILDARALSVGGVGCAVRRNGRVACWRDPTPWDAASAQGDVPGIHHATEVAVGAFGACAVESTGRLVCWGAASLIPWAPGPRGGSPPKPTPSTELRGVRDVVHVSLRGDFPCLVRTTGRVLCWFPQDAPTLLPRNPLPPGSEVRDITDAVALSEHLVLRRNGALAGVSIAYDAQGDMTLVSHPVGKGVLTDVVDADGSPEHGCAVNRSGAVICWGILAPGR